MSSLEECLGRAKDFYKDVKAKGGQKKLDTALQMFKEVTLRCPCNNALFKSFEELGLALRDMAMPTCHCRDFVSLSVEHADSKEDDGDKLAMYKLATKPCSCGSSITPCRSAIHIAALEGICAVYEAQKKHDQAIQTSSLLIIIAPHAPEGYLRMVKNLRLRAHANRNEVSSQWMYVLTQAGASVRQFGDKNHRKLEAIRHMLRTDPMRRFPAEVQQMILGYLPHADICRGLRVSKLWNAACRDRVLWRDLRFVKGWRSVKPRPFPQGVLADILSRRAQNLATSLTINGLKEFGLDADKLKGVLQALPRLEMLSVSGTHKLQVPKKQLGSFDPALSFTRVTKAIFHGAHPGLKVLHLGNLVHDEPLLPPRLMMPKTNPQLSKSLEELQLTNILRMHYAIEGVFYPGGGQVWPELKKLCISYGETSTARNVFYLDMFWLANRAPNLVDLTLDHVRSHRVVAIPSLPGYWKDLERLRVGTRPSRFYLPSSKLRSLELSECLWPDYEHLFQETMSQPKLDIWLEHLEHFGFIGQGGTMRAPCFDRLKPSCTNGTLRSLHVDFLALQRQHWDDMLNKPAIHTLSCEKIQGYAVSDSGHAAFLDWLLTFPNVRTVGICLANPSEPDSWRIIAFLLKRRPDIKTIYTNALHGVYRDAMLEQATQIGVKILHGKRVPEPELLPSPPPPGPSMKPADEQDGADGAKDDGNASEIHVATG